MPRAAFALLVAAAVLLLPACGGGGGTKEEVPSKDTFECTLEGERWLVRFVDSEARLLTPQGQRVNLYQVPSGSGVRYTNGLIELRGKGMDLMLTQDAFTRKLDGCKPLMVPKEDPNPMLRMWQPPPPQPLGR